MNTSLASPSPILIIGTGPAGLMAAEQLARRGHRVEVFEKMPSVARKFLMAGRGGLNLTHSEPRPDFEGRYGAASDQITSWLDGFDAAALIDWANDLGQETFVGSSGRIFPRSMKASPLLRAWLARLEELGVSLHTRHNWVGRNGQDWQFETADGLVSYRAKAVILALGGGSYAKLGSDGRWMDWMQKNAISTQPLQATNVGFEVEWSQIMRDRFAGQPLKTIRLSHQGRSVHGELLISSYGLEGGAIYALSSHLRQAIEQYGHTSITIDLRPTMNLEDLTTRLSKPKGKMSLSNHLRKSVGLDATSIALLREAGALPDNPQRLAQLIKAVPLRLTGIQGIDRAISTAGGVRMDQVDNNLMLRAMSGVFVCGEMLDWEAPTGGYLLQACFASGVRVAKGVSDFLQT